MVRGTEREDGNWVCSLTSDGAASEEAQGASQAADSWLVESASRLSMTGGEMCFLSRCLLTLWVMLQL